MANGKPDVRVRLTAEGIKEVTDALKKIGDEATKQGLRSKNAFASLTASFGGVRGLISKVTAAVGGLSFIRLTKEAVDYADAIGKAAQKTGAGTESLSVLRVAASTADVEVDQLDKGLIKLAVNTGKLAEGNKELERSFAALGLAKEDFAGKDTGQQFAIIADRLSKIRDGAQKTKLAYDIFGKAGAQLIPLLNQLGTEGFDAVREKAERMGLIVTQEAALLAENVNDSFTEIRNQVRGLALQFISGLLPSVKGAMDGFKEATEGEGVDAMKTFGQEVGRVLRVVIQLFKIAETVISTVLQVIGRGLAANIAAIQAVLQRDFRRAGSILIDAFGETGDILKAGFEEAFGEFDKLVQEANKKEIELDIKPIVRGGAPEDVESGEELAARKKRESELERERAKQAAEEKKLADQRESAAQRLFDIETQLADTEGKRQEAFERNLAKDTAEIAKLLEVVQAADADRQRIIDRFTTSSRASFNLEELKTQFDQAMQALDDARERININAQAGVIAQFQAEQQILALEAQRIPQLQAINVELQKAATAIGTEAVAGVEQYTLAIEQLQATQKAATDASIQFRQAAVEGIEQGISSVLKNLDKFEDAGDVIKGVFRSIAQAIADLAAEIIAKQATLALLRAFGGGAAGGTGFAEGGEVGGQGTGTSDSNLAWLSKGEFVVRQSVVRQPGAKEFLEAMNDGFFTPRVRQFKTGYPRFAEGGLNAGGQNGSTSPSGGGVRIINVLDPQLVTSAIGSPSGEKSIMNVIQRNAQGIRRLIAP